MVNKHHLEWLRNRRRIMSALAIETLQGREPTHAALAARAGLGSKKTVSRRVRDGLDLVTTQDRMLRLVASNVEALATAADSLGNHAARYDGAPVGADGLALWAWHFSSWAETIVGFMNRGLAHRWVTALEEFQSRLPDADREQWPNVWGARGFDADGCSITGFMRGMAQTNVDWFRDGTPAEIDVAPPSPNPVVGLPDVSIVDSLALYAFEDEFLEPDMITTGRHPMLRGERWAFLAGYFFAGNLERAHSFAKEHVGDLGSLPLHQRADLTRYLGARFMGWLDNDPLSCVFPGEDERRLAKEIAAALAPEGAAPSIGDRDDDLARLNAWAAWIREDPEDVLRQAPLVAGPKSVRAAVQRREPWIQTPDLIPLLHEAAEETGRDDLAAFMQESALAYLRREDGARGQAPIPLGLLARLLSLAVEASGDPFGWEPESSPRITSAELTDVRLAFALGGALDTGTVEDLRAIVDALRRSYSLTRVGPVPH